MAVIDVKRSHPDDDPMRVHGADNGEEDVEMVHAGTVIGNPAASEFQRLVRRLRRGRGIRPHHRLDHESVLQLRVPVVLGCR